MKKTEEAYKRISEQEVGNLAKLLSLKKKSEQQITAALTTQTGLHTVLSGLSQEELRVLFVTYKAKGPVTLGEIEKKSGVEISELVRITFKLSQLLLIYIIKNRQLLSNKLDKIYRIKEIDDTLNIAEAEDICERISKIAKTLKDPSRLHGKQPAALDQTQSKLIMGILEQGLMIELGNANEIAHVKNINTLLDRMIEAKLITIMHLLNDGYKCLIILNEPSIRYAFQSISTKAKTKGSDINNHCHLAINLLYTFDCISSYGLFLTKQNKFRIIDKKRISDSMLPIYLSSGEMMEQEKISDLCLYLLHCMGCLRIKKDITHVSLKPLSEDIQELDTFIFRIIHSSNPSETPENLFYSPLLVPAYKSTSQIMHLLMRHEAMSRLHLNASALAVLFSGGKNDNAEHLFARREIITEQINATIDFLCITGLIQISGECIILTDIGRVLAKTMFLTEETSDGSKLSKKIYINPDFSLHVPVEEIPSQELYQIMSHASIEKIDVMMHAIINRQSIIQANKRGLRLERFRTTLNNLAKNEIPQNLDFLLQEWSSQTLKVGIEEVILLHATQDDFIKDILYHSKKQDLIVEFISDNWAIIKKEAIDEIVKIARKQEAVISLFESVYEK